MIERLCSKVFSRWSISFSSPAVEESFRASTKKICIAAHSTPFLDGMILHAFLMRVGVPDHVFFVRGLFGMGPSWCKEIINGGFIANEIKELKNRENFCRVIFPSGGNVKWKTGFYALAKELEADVIILGLDYSNKRVVVDSFISNKITFEEARTEAIQRLQKYSAGPLCFSLRVLIGYGCMTYDVSWEKLLLIRLFIVTVLIFIIFTSAFLILLPKL